MTIAKLSAISIGTDKLITKCYVYSTIIRTGEIIKYPQKGGGIHDDNLQLSLSW